MSDFIKVNNPQCGCMNCNENEKYLQIKNHLSEFNTELAKAEARLNLGIPDKWNLKWGNITGFIEEQTDLKEYLDNYTEVFKETIWESFDQLKKELLVLINDQLQLVEDTRQIVLGLIRQFEQLEEDIKELFNSLKEEFREELNSKIPYDEWDNLINTNNHIGGYHQVTTLEEMNNIPDKFKKIGMLCYVKDDPNKIFTYQWNGTEWVKSKIGAGIEKIDTEADKKDLNPEPGDVIYINDTEDIQIYTKDGTWNSLQVFYIGNEEPLNKSVVWIDPSDNSSLESEADEDINNIRKALQLLQYDVSQLTKLITIGIVPGDVTNSYRQDLINNAEPEEPEIPEDMLPEGVTTFSDLVLDPDKPDVTPAEFTVNCVCAKQDTAANFTKNKADLVDGELLFYTDRREFVIYYGGRFYAARSGDSSGSGGGNGISVEDLYNLPLDYLIFSNGEKNYKAYSDKNGQWVVREHNNNVTSVGSPHDTWKTYISQYLCMNTIYCGGKGGEDCLVSHNFVELANASKQDINLNGLYLLYSDLTKENTDDIGYIWKVLPLEGVIKAGSTFLIRGAQCNTPKSCFITVKDYDIEWYDNEELISFNQGAASFYLCAGTEFQELLDTNSLSTPWVKDNIKVGYIDSCGFGAKAVYEGNSSYTFIDKEQNDWSKLMFIRWYMLEPAKQGNKAYNARQTKALWTHINLEKQTTKLGNSKQYYYPDYMKQRFAPASSSQNKNFFTNKNDFYSDRPNMINITFGIQATDNGQGATRCFNWVSVGYYDEYIQYRKKGESIWTTIYSIINNDDNNPDYIKTFIDHYQRLRWKTSSGIWVTSHKCIIKNLSAGEYEYKIGRDNDSSYQSDILSFKVHSNSEVKSFSFIQTSDQQGFNWAEYTAWKKASSVIAESEQNWNFTINTGDATQSGNRTNEWYDYYEGRQFLRDKEEMYTIGNNDLCGKIATELTDGEDATSKYNHINILRYFTFELDPNNKYSCDWDGEERPIYSLYSFNYGDYHFISLNSELATASSKMFKNWQSDSEPGDSGFAKNGGAAIEEWLKKDLQLWTGEENPTNCSKCIVYMHEMPFTIVTYSFMNSSDSARVGSHLNTLNANGEYRFSRLFKKYGIRLVMGGHKHTYSISKPIYDAPENYITNNKINTQIDLLENPVNAALSRIPVIQVTRQQDIQDNNYARYELVTKINAPTYVMSQATGYKLVSNKEQPSGNQYTIPWLLSYFKAASNAASPTENAAQHRPMYIRYDMNDNSIKVTAKQIHNIWNVDIQSNKSSFDMNKQLTDIYSEAMTLSTISNEDKQAYNITDLQSYIINL